MLLDSWLLHLRAERKSPETVKTYGDGVRRFLAWCAVEGATPVLDRPTVNAFVTALLDAGAEPSTARSRHLAVRRFSCSPRIGSPDSSRCARARDFRDVRDMAVIRLMIETGARAGGVVAMPLDDVDLTRGVGRGASRQGREGPQDPDRAAHVRPVSIATCELVGAICAGGPSWPASLASTRTCCGTPPRPAGSPPVAVGAGLWPWPDGVDET